MKQQWDSLGRPVALLDAWQETKPFYGVDACGRLLVVVFVWRVVAWWWWFSVLFWGGGGLHDPSPGMHCPALDNLTRCLRPLLQT